MAIIAAVDESAMAGKIYTPSELLRLKNTPMNRELYNQLQEKLRQDQELGMDELLPSLLRYLIANQLL